jgi:hypothetical protein
MIGVLIIILSVLFAGALPWWPYSASGRLQHRRPWDWLRDQGQNTGHIEIMGSTRLEGGPTDALAEQLAAVCEESHVRGRHGPREAYATRYPAAVTGIRQDRLVA